MQISQIVTRNRQVTGPRTATIFKGRRRTWEQHAERVARLAAGLHKLGLDEGDRVAMLALNSDRYLEWFFATSWAGGVFVPINTRLAPPEILHWLTDSGTSILFIDENFLSLLPTLRAGVPTLREVVPLEPTDAEPAGNSHYEQLIGDAEPVPPSERGGGDLAGLFYTGGTTGVSKGVMLSHDNLLINALQVTPTCGFNPDTRYLHAAPMFHLANGLGMFGAALAGSTHIMVPTFTPDLVLDAITADAVTSTVMVPTMVSMIANATDPDLHDLSTWRTLIYGGSPIPEAGIQAIRRVAPHLDLIQAYGQTEASPTVSLLPPDRHTFSGPLAGKTRSAGQAVCGVEVAILDDLGEELPRGAVGEICARGDGVMIGYYNRPDETAAALRDGWLHTQDAGYMDDDGFIFVVDRLKDMIVSGGENIYSAEVENALAAHPDVLECAVIGIPSERWGEQVHAVVALETSSTAIAEDLISHCKSLIAAYKCPRSVELVAGLPKSGAGKILKQALRAPYWAGQERAVH